MGDCPPVSRPAVDSGGKGSFVTLKGRSRMPENDNAQRFVERLDAHRSAEQREQYRRYFKLGEGEYGEGDEFIGVRMGQVFDLAKEFIEMAPDEIEKLLENPIHEVRAPRRRPRSENPTNRKKESR